MAADNRAIVKVLSKITKRRILKYLVIPFQGELLESVHCTTAIKRIVRQIENRSIENNEN